MKTYRNYLLSFWNWVKITFLITTRQYLNCVLTNFNWKEEETNKLHTHTQNDVNKFLFSSPLPIKFMATFVLDIVASIACTLYRQMNCLSTIKHDQIVNDLLQCPFRFAYHQSQVFSPHWSGCDLIGLFLPPHFCYLFACDERMEQNNIQQQQNVEILQKKNRLSLFLFLYFVCVVFTKSFRRFPCPIHENIKTPYIISSSLTCNRHFQCKLPFLSNQ